MSAQNGILVADLALDYATNKRTGCLEVQYGLLRGEIHFQFGMIIQAEYQGKKGAPALYELVQMENAHVLWHEGLMPMYVAMSVDLGDVIRDIERARLPVAPTTHHNGVIHSVEETEPPAAMPQVTHEKTTQHIPVGANADLEEYDSSLARSYLMELTWIDCRRPGPSVFLLEDDHQACYLVGRAKRCQIIIDDPSVESVHCSLLVHDQNLEVWDLGTDRQTSLNGRVIEMGTLDIGDILTIGTVSLKYELLLRRKLNGTVSAGENRHTVVVSAGKLPTGAITYGTLNHDAENHHKKHHDGALHHIFTNIFHKKSRDSVLANRAHKPVSEDSINL